MKITEPSQPNEWNHHHTYLAQALPDFEDFVEERRSGAIIHLPAISNRNQQGHLQDRATRMLTEKAVHAGRKIRQ